MKMSGEQVIPAPRARVWDALNDPEVLRQSIPGCTELVRHSATEFTAKVLAKVGPVKAKFAGDVTLSKLNPPHSYLISGKGTGGVAGFAEGGAEVRLEEEVDGNTKLIYDVDAKVGGKLAQIGSRLIDSTARRMADDFFRRFGEVVSSDAPIAGKAPDAAAKRTPAKKASARKAPAAKKAVARKSANGKARKAAAKSTARSPEFAAGPETAHSPSLMPEIAVAASASGRDRSVQPPSQQRAAVTNIWWIVGAGLAALLVILILAKV
jgi:hypothetical protein